MAANSAALRERNRKRRGRKRIKIFTLRHAVDAVLIAAVIVLIVGWAVRLPVMFLITGCVIAAASAPMSALSFIDFFKAEKKSPEYKAAIWGMCFYTLFLVVGILLIVYGAAYLPGR